MQRGGKAEPGSVGVTECVPQGMEGRAEEANGITFQTPGNPAVLSELRHGHRGAQSASHRCGRR